MDTFDDIFNDMEELMFAEEMMAADRAKNAVIEQENALHEAAMQVPVDPNAFPEVINILDLDVRESFIQDVLNVGYETEWFTKPVVPTVTLDGRSTGILFHEEQLISELEATPHVIMFTCNFGKVVYPGYTPPQPAKKRKKIVLRRRKVQGDGSAFSSQISCFVPRIDYTQPWTDTEGNVHEPEMTPDRFYYIIPTNAPRFEYKIFRNGRLQLPGATLTTFEEGIAGAKLMQHAVWEAIGNFDIQPEVTSMSSVMINFKFVVKLRRRHIVDLRALRTVLENERRRTTDGVRVNRVQYSRQKTNLAAEIIVEGIPYVTRVNIYLRGRVNLIGVKIPSVAAKIFDFLHMIFSTTNEPALTRREGGICYTPMIRNVRPATDPVMYAQMIFSGPSVELTADTCAGITDLLTIIAEENDREVACGWQALQQMLTA